MRNKKLLIVGVGGIGCEAIISVLQMGFNNLIIIDLDHIERSNLNRQFLFKREDINKKKAKVAAKNLKLLFPSSNITSYTKSILDTSSFPLSFFKGVDLIISALDNIEARRHLNMIAHLVKKPFIDSGSQGFRGQVTPIIPTKTPCYECFTNQDNEAESDENNDSGNSLEFSESDNDEEDDFIDITNINPKAINNKLPQNSEVIPICSIRSIPSEPVHCAIWAKELVIIELNNIIKDNKSKSEYKEMVESMVKEKIIETNFNLLEEGMVLKEDTTTQIDKIKQELIGYSLDYILKIRKDGEEINEIEYDKENNEIVQLITLASNIKAKIFKLQTLDTFTIKGLLSEIREAFISTNATIGCIIALMAKDILSNIGQMRNYNYWINQDIDTVMNRTKTIKPDVKCKVCNRRVLKINRKLLNNDADWFFGKWLKKQITQNTNRNKRVKLAKRTVSEESESNEGEYVISYCNNDIIQMEEDLKESETSMIGLLRLGERGDFFYLDHDENNKRFFTVLII